MALKINIGNYKKLYFEIRYVKSNLTKSFPIFGIYFSKYDVNICILSFFINFGKIRDIKPTPLTKEEIKEVEEILKTEEGT